MHHDSRATDVARWLSEFDLDLDVDSLLLERLRSAPALVIGPAGAAHYQLVVDRGAVLSGEGRVGERPVLLAADYISPQDAVTLRRQGIQYIDASGNARITARGVVIDVQGRPREKRPSSADHRTANLFSPRRAQVILALLAWPQLADGGVRDLAKVSQVSLGQAHDTLVLLEKLKYVSPRSGLHRRLELLDHWTTAYPTGLSPRLELRSYAGPVTDLKVTDPEDPVFVSGEWATEGLIRGPETLTLYVDFLDPMLPIANRWRADGEPNIFVRRKFWNPPADEASAHGVERAPWPLVYADLMVSHDPRQQRVAAEWRDRHAGPDALR